MWLDMCFFFTFIEFFNVALINVIAILIMPAKLPTPGLLKV